METGRIIILTGAPGTGKTTIAALLAEQSDRAKSVHLHTDDLYRALAKGAVPPHLPESNAQNAVVIEAFLAAALRFVRGGYDVVVDGVVGPWFLYLWVDAAKACEIHYVILRADKAETMRRAIARDPANEAQNCALVEAMWAQFCNLGAYEANVIETTDRSEKATLAAVQAAVRSGQYRLIQIT